MKSRAVTLSKRISPVQKAFVCLVIVMAAMVLLATPPPPLLLRVMATGIGSGTITVNGISCGGGCDQTLPGPASITFTATPAGGSSFVRWEGDVTGTSSTITVSLGASSSVRAIFDLTTPIPVITDFTPAGLQAYLAANPVVNTPARFLKALPAEFRQNWILMSRSESLQTGTAKFPRLLLTSGDARSVFTIGMAVHESYPGSDPNAIEYMQWDGSEKNFRFHEVILDNIPLRGTVLPRTRSVSIDDSKCSKCHSTRNVLNPTTDPGTTGIPAGTVKYKNKPNWDAYDSWGGMLPFNRDRIYQGSVEAAAFRKLLNPWTWRNDPSIRSIIEQLDLQPPGVPAHDAITRTVGGANDGHINFRFDAAPPVVTEPAPAGDASSINTNYSFNAAPGSGTATPVIRGGEYVVLRHSSDVSASTDPTLEEGRGVQLFDLLGGLDGTLNQQRVSDELISHRYATGSFPIDIRPIALAISRGFITLNAAKTAIVTTTPLTVDLTFFDSRTGSTINQVYNDTRDRARTLPRRKVDMEQINMNRIGDKYLIPVETTPTNGLIAEYGGNTAAGTSVSLDRVRQEIFRRPNDLGVSDVTPMGGIFVDRELYNINTEKIALFRYFLEPLGVSVDKWSMGVRGRSRTYSFADIFGSYTNVFNSELGSSMTNTADPRYRPVAGLTDAANESQLIGAVNSTLALLPAATDPPTYTDIQRIFNKSCVECHGGLNYPPYYGSFGPLFLDLSEDELPPAGTRRLDRANGKAMMYTTADTLTSAIYQRITMPNEDCPGGLMPCGGPALSKTDRETISRWILGGRPYSQGDPHINTVDGTNYDFQAAGEFVLLRGENFEMQARHGAVGTDAPLGPNAHTGLTSCVSVNTAFAARIGRHRISYQPGLDGKPDPTGLQLRVDGRLAKISEQAISLGSDGRIIKTSAPGGIQIETAGGTVIVITPGWWDYYKVWFLHIDTRGVRATEGLMGKIAPGNWLPALPDGTLMGPMPPTDLKQRFSDLYDRFGKAWRVTDSTTLFDYAPGLSSKSFTLENWPRRDSIANCQVPRAGEKQPLKPIARAEAERFAAAIVDSNRKANAIMDMMVTGEPAFAKTYLLADKIARNNYPNPAGLVFPKDFDTLRLSDVKFEWNKTTDKDGDPLTYKLYVWPITEAPNNNNAIPVSSERRWWSGNLAYPLIVALIGLLIVILLYYTILKRRRGSLLWALLFLVAAIIIAYLFGKPTASFSQKVPGLKTGSAYFWKVITEDGQGGTVESKMRRIDIR